MSRNILITGATGRQGGAVIDQLLKEPSQLYTIYALTRNVDSAFAKALVSRSSTIQLVAGDLDKPSEVFISIAAPIWAVFSVQAGIGPGMTAEREEEQGKALIDASVAHGVKHFIYSSVPRGDPPEPTFVPQFQAKHATELHLFSTAPASGMDWTVLRPVVFFENLKNDYEGLGFAAILKYYIPPEKPIRYIACRDIGWFAAKAICNPQSYKDRTITLAGDELTFQQFADVFKQTTGKPLPLPWGWWLVPSILFFFLKDLRTLFRYFAEDDQAVDISGLKREHPELQDIQEWLRSSDFISH